MWYEHMPPSAFSSSSNDVMASGWVDLREGEKEEGGGWITALREGIIMLFCTKCIFWFLKEFLSCVFCVLIVHGSRIGLMETSCKEEKLMFKKKTIQDSVHVPDSGRYYFINRINTFTDELRVMTVWKTSQTAYGVMANISKLHYVVDWWHLHRISFAPQQEYYITYIQTIHTLFK